MDAVTTTGTPCVDLYVGALIEHASEKQVLEYLFSHFTNSGRKATILANINLLGRQIDFVVGTSGLTLVIEVKSYSRAVRGGLNGNWETKSASGGWRKIRNPYIQVLDAKYVLRDAMQRFACDELQYPEAAVVIVPCIPIGSQINPGDFKAAITGLDGMERCLSISSKCVWNAERWSAFAASLHLTRTQNVAAACSQQISDAEQLLSQYTDSFRRTYGPNVVGLIPDSFQLGERTLRTDEIVRHVVDGSADVLVQGPSGCGKTLLATNIGLSFLQKSGFPLMVQARQYEGRLGEVLDREAALLDASSTKALFRALRVLDAPLLLIVDGYNECNEKLALTRGLRAAARRYGAQLLVTSQGDLERSDLLELEQIHGREPSLDMKAAIAGVEVQGSANEGLKSLLNSVSTGLEARLVGEIGNEVGTCASRYALFDAFARSRLLGNAADGIRLLARISGLLLQRLSFSLSVRDLERLAEVANVSQAIVQRLISTQLLATRGDRVSFRHELFFAAFAAEAVVREANGDAKSILAALRAPRYHSSRILILGAIDDVSLLDQVLSAIDASDLLVACYRGECGQAARIWVAGKSELLAAKLGQEAAGLQFQVTDSGWMNVSVISESLRPWSLQDRAVLQVIATAIMTGEHLDIVLDAIAQMDATLERSHAALREEAREKKIPLRSALFANAYVFPGSESAGVSRITSGLHSGWISRAPESAPLRAQIQLAWKRNPTPGQIYLLLMLSKHQENSGAIVAPYLIELLSERWPRLPYHLQLDVVDCVHWCRDFEEPHRSALIEALEALLHKVNPLFSGMVFEALEALGALESPQFEHMELVRSQMIGLLQNPSDPTSREAAWSIYVGQFDHPLSGAYCEVVRDLDRDQRKRFSMLACDGATDTSLFITPLIIEIAECGDPAAGPSLERWTRLPPSDSFMPQEALAVFVSAHIGLGHLGCRLPDNTAFATSSASAALAACGALYYWTNRRDIPAEERVASCERFWKILMEPDQGAAVGAMLQCEKSLQHGMVRILKEPSEERSVIRHFPYESVTICRQALRRSVPAAHYFPHGFMSDQRDQTSFAISVLGAYGDATDLVTLKALSDDAAVGIAAIAAIQQLEARTTRPSPYKA